MRYLCLLGVFFLAVPAAAQEPLAKITLSTHLDPWSEYTLCQQAVTTTDLVVGATISTPCNNPTLLGFPNPLPVIGLGEAKASFGAGGLTIGASYRLSGTPAPVDTFDGYTIAEAYDTVTVNDGPAGANGTLRLSFTVNGIIQITRPPVNNNFKVGGVFDFNGNRMSTSGSTTIVTDYPVVFGQPTRIRFNMRAEVITADGNGSCCFDVNVDFNNTAHLILAEVLDSNGNVVPDATLTSAGGATYPGLSPVERFDFTGFFHPVDNGGVLNVVKAGSGVPVKFSLAGDRGLEIFESGYPRSQWIECASNAPSDAIEEAVTAGQSSLSYDATSQTYVYVWKTDKSWAGSCRELQVKFTDGQVRTARFAFSK